MSAQRRNTGPDAGEISRLLAASAEKLCGELLSAGRRLGGEWTVGSVANEPGDSMSVNLRGKPGVWADFSTGESGDALDLVAAILYRGDVKQAYAWALTWLGLSRHDAPATTRAYVPAANPDTLAADDEAKRQRSALRLYLEAQPSLAGTPADLYLQARGIDLRRLGRQPRALRFLARCWCHEADTHLPALIAAVTDHEGRHVATHRTWLALHGGVWGKARVQNPKKTLGRPRGGTIRLWRGASGRPLAQAEMGETVAIGEGIETCLSVALACPELRVLSAVSLANLGSVALPEAVRTVLIAADNDSGLAAARGLQRAVDAYLASGRDVRIARSPVGKDFNDCVRS